MPLHPKIAREQDIAVLARGLQRVNRTAGTQRTSNAGTWFIPDGTFDENGTPTGSGVVIGSQATDFDGIAHRNPDGTLKPLVDTSAIDDKLNSAQEDIDKLNQSLVQVNKTLVTVNQTLEDNSKTVIEAQEAANNALSTATSANETARQANENATQAQTAADKAQTAATQTASDLTELAGITGRVIFSDTAPTGSAQNSNNMWVDGDGRPHEWNGSQWVLVTDLRITSAAQAANEAHRTAVDAQSAADAARDQALNALNEAQTAKGNAQSAQAAADKAQAAANTAQANATAAKQSADKATQDVATLAGITGRVIYSPSAPTGDDRSENNLWIDSNGQPHRWNGSNWVLVTDSRITAAAQTANSANTKAEQAQTVADEAKEAAENAQSIANQAHEAAQNAQNTANAAKTTAQNAAATANAAKTAADNAQDAASSAKTAANAAQAAANSAKSIADAATQNVADLAEITGRVIYSSSAPTGADRNGNNLWIDSNGQPHRWNGSAWVLVTDSRITSAANTANQANSAAQSAQSAAQSAQNTAKAAQTAANDAKTAARNAQTAATSAQNAANTAKDAASDAQTTASEAKNVASSARSAATQAQATATAANQAATSAQTAANQALTSATQYIKNQQFTGSNIDGVGNTQLNANDSAAGTLPQSAKTYGKSTGGYDNRFENVRIKGIPGHTYRIECDVRPASGFNAGVTKDGVGLFFLFMRSDNPGLAKDHYTPYEVALVPPTVKDWTHATYDYVFPNSDVDKVMRPAWRTEPRSDKRWLITNCVCYDATEYIALQKLADTAQDAANKANTAAQNAAAIANRAEAAAKNAQTTANGKNKIFTQSSEPSHSGLVPGDQWNVTNSSGQVTANRVWNGSSFVEHKLYLSSLAVPSSVGTTLIQNNAITTGKVAANAINASKIAADAVTADKIASNAVTADSIASNAVGTNELAANAVTTAKLNVTEDMTVKLLAAHKIQADEIDLNTLNGVTINGMVINGGELSVGNTGNRIHIHNNADISNIDFLRNGSEIAKMYFIYDKARKSTVFVISSGQEQITNRAYIDGAQPDSDAPNGWTISSNHNVRILPQHTLDMFGETCSMQFTNAVNISTGRMTLHTSGGKIYLDGNAHIPINTLARCRVKTYDNNANRYEFDMPTFRVVAGSASLFASATGANGTRGIRVQATGLYAICGQVNVTEVNGNSGEVDIRRTPNGGSGWSSVMSTGFTVEPASFSGGWTSVTIPWQYVYLNSSDVVTLGFTRTWARKVGSYTMMSIRPVAL